MCTTCPDNHIWLQIIWALILKQSALSNTSVSAVRVCQLILRIHCKYVWGNLSSHFRCQQYVVQVSEEYRNAVRTPWLIYPDFNLPRNTMIGPYSLFQFSKGNRCFLDTWVYFSIQRAVSRQSTPKIYKSVNYLQSDIIYEYIWLRIWFTWCRCEHHLHLFQTYCEPEGSASSWETIHYLLHISFTMSKNVSIVSV